MRNDRYTTSALWKATRPSCSQRAAMVGRERLWVSHPPSRSQGPAVWAGGSMLDGRPYKTHFLTSAFATWLRLSERIGGSRTRVSRFGMVRLLESLVGVERLELSFAFRPSTRNWWSTLDPHSDEQRSQPFPYRSGFDLREVPLHRHGVGALTAVSSRTSCNPPRDGSELGS